MRYLLTYIYSALSYLPSEPLTVTTPVNATYEGIRFSHKVRGAWYSRFIQLTLFRFAVSPSCVLVVRWKLG
jgi:hypothetical protein